MMCAADRLAIEKTLHRYAKAKPVLTWIHIEAGLMGVYIECVVENL